MAVPGVYKKASGLFGLNKQKGQVEKYLEKCVKWNLKEFKFSKRDKKIGNGNKQKYEIYRFSIKSHFFLNVIYEHKSKQ